MIDRVTRRSLLFGAAAAGLLRAVPIGSVKLGVTSDEIDEDVTKAAEFLERFGLRYAEVRSIWGKYNTVQPVDKVTEARGIFDAHKIRTSIVDTTVFRGAIPADAVALDKEWKNLDDSMERASILGTDLLRIFSFLPKDGNVNDTADFPKTYELLKEASAKAKQRGCRLAVENLKGSYVQTGKDSGRMLKAVAADNLGLAWDPNNAGSVGEKSFPDGYKKLDAARIFHVHLRDYKRKPDGSTEWTAVGAGEFDNAGQLRALLKDGFKGTLSLETHWRPPEGKAYATEISLKALMKVIESV